MNFIFLYSAPVAEYEEARLLQKNDLQAYHTFGVFFSPLFGLGWSTLTRGFHEAVSFFYHSRLIYKSEKSRLPEFMEA